MDIENESSSSSPSSSSSCQLSPCKPCNPNSELSEEAPPPTSHKRKAGRKKFKETRHPVYKGVRQRNGNRWVCEVREPNKKSRIWLGTFPTPEMAARAHDVAALALRGDFAALNFPDSASKLPRAKSSSARDIQMAALEAAEAFKETLSSPSSSYSQMNSSCETSSRKDLRPSSIHLQSVKNEEKVLEPSSVEKQCVENEKMVLEPCSMDMQFGKRLEKVWNEPRTLFLDEEALFNMPGLLDSMAEGLILTPPAIRRGYTWDDTACAMDLNLWRD